jgi:hypothetical protein
MSEDEMKSKIRIQTRLKYARLISSVWRQYANENFESWAWETVMFSFGEIEREYESLIRTEDVINLHMKIMMEDLDRD